MHALVGEHLLAEVVEHAIAYPVHPLAGAGAVEAHACFAEEDGGRAEACIGVVEVRALVDPRSL